MLLPRKISLHIMAFICVVCGCTECSVDCYPGHAGQYACHNQLCYFHRAVVTTPNTKMPTRTMPARTMPTRAMPTRAMPNVTTRPAFTEIPRNPQPGFPAFSISKIEPGLFIGNLACVSSDEYLRSHNITAVVSVTTSSELPPVANLISTHPLKKFDPSNHLMIRAGDSKSTNLLKELPGACKFISKHLSPLKPWLTKSGTKESRQGVITPSNKDRGQKNQENRPAVLIHCRKGVSRSATIAIGYLMWKDGKGSAATLSKVRQKRPSISPNSSFLNQLDLWGKLDYNLWEDAKHLIPKDDYRVFMDELAKYKRV